MNFSKISLALVSIQFIAGAILLLSSEKNNINYFSILLIFSGIYVSLWGIFTMKRGVIRIVPEVSHKATLITDGPYKWIRHPMYSGIIIAGLGLILTQITVFRVSVYLILTIDLVIKLNYEEKLLEKHFSNYKLYKMRTKRLLPYIY